MPLDDYASTSGPVGQSAANANPRSGKKTSGKSQNGKDEILINPDIKDVIHERVVTLQQRRVRANQMRRQSSRLTRARAISRLKLATGKQLERRAHQAAKQNIRRRFAGSRGVEYHNLGPSDKVSVDRQIDAKVRSIQALVQRIIPRIKQADVKRLQAVRTGKAYRSGPLPQFNSVELSISEFNKLYEMVFNTEDDSLNEKFSMFYEDAASHLRQATIAQQQGKIQKASIHRKIAAALQRGDATSATSLRQQLHNVTE
jgi:hypothetical protein